MSTSITARLGLRCRLLLWVLPLLWLAACGGSGGGSEAPATPPATSAEVDVRVSALDGSALANVRVTPSVGSATATTNAQGVARLTLANNQTLSLVFSHASYANQVKVLSLPAGAASALVTATLIERDAAQTVADMATGGTVNGRDGTRAVFPAGSLVDASGNTVTGPVQVQMTPVNVLSAPAAFPGTFLGMPEGSAAGAAPVGIVSFGTVEFHPTQNGQKLQVKAGSRVSIDIPIYSSRNQDGSAVVLGQVIKLWSLNETTGLWVQEGTGTVVASADSTTGLALRAEVSHFSWWNCDDIVGLQAIVNVQCMLLDAAGNPTVALAAGQSCSIRAEVPDARNRPVLRADAVAGPQGLQGLRIPADTPVVLYGEAVPGGQQGLVSVRLAPGATQSVVIPLVQPVAVSLLRPLANTALAASATAAASVAGAVDRVDLFLGGVLVDQSRNQPYTFSFSTAASPEGAVQIEARAVRGNVVVGSSGPRTVFVDNTAPVVNLLRLNATAGDGRVELQAQVSDLSPIREVAFFRNGVRIGQTSTFPYRFTYTLQPNETDPVSFNAQATDAAGNVGSSNVLSFGTAAPTITLVRTPSTASISSSQAVLFQATAASGNGIARVEFFKGSTLIDTVGSSPYQTSYTVTGADQPSFSITARVVDNAGIVGSATLVTPVAFVTADVTPPTVQLQTVTSPITQGGLTLNATATDNIGVAKVDFLVNGVFKASSSTPAGGLYTANVDVSLLNGSTTFTARAFDAAGNTADSSQTAVVSIPVVFLSGVAELVHRQDAFCAPQLAIAPDGTPHLAHMVKDASGVFDVQVSRRVGGAWQSLGFANDTSNTQVQRGDGNYCPNIVVRPDGTPMVAFAAYFNRTPGAITGSRGHVVRSFNGSGWSDSRVIQVALSGPRNLLALDAQGRPVLAWLRPDLATTSYRVALDRFEGGAWNTLAIDIGGSQNVSDLRMAARPDGSMVLALRRDAPLGSDVVAYQVSAAGTVDFLGTLAQTASTVQGLNVQAVAASAAEVVVSILQSDSSGQVPLKVLGFNATARTWALLGTASDQLLGVREGDLAFQGGSLVQVVGVPGTFSTGQARRWNGSAWSGFINLTPVQNGPTMLTVGQGSLYLAYQHFATCCGPDGATVVKLNLP